MVITIFDKNGKLKKQINNVVKIKTMYLNDGMLYDTLLNLQIELENGQIIEYYLSEYDRFAIIEKENVNEVRK